MTIKIHRGQNQIGGSIVEVSTEKARIFLDAGINLDEGTEIEVPQINGIFCGEKACDGVFISHYHCDHMGLLPSLLQEIPIYMGEKAYDVFSAAANYRGAEVSFVPRFLHDKIVVKIGDIKIAPLLCDHSAYDSYMFLIEAESKSVLYTGDFRANGRLDFEKLVANIPKVDAVIIEGTTLSRETMQENIEEEKLEEIAENYLKKHSGPAFILMSAMNVDRLKTAYNVAQKTGRLFLEDIYTADIATAANDETLIPNIENGVRVFSTGGDKQYARLQQYGNAKIGKHQIAKLSFVMCIRQSMKNYLSKLNELVSFKDAVLFYAMWKGYMQQPEMSEFLEFMENKGVKIHVLHTSGHADGITIDRLIKAAKPKVIIPIHTENAKWYDKYSDSSKVVYSENMVCL